MHTIHEKTKTTTKSKVDDVSIEIHKVAAYSLMGIGILTGLWSFSCVFFGTIAAGGFFPLVSSWFCAITGN